MVHSATGTPLVWYHTVYIFLKKTKGELDGRAVSYIVSTGSSAVLELSELSVSPSVDESVELLVEGTRKSDGRSFPSLVWLLSTV